MAMMICPKCKNEVADDVKLCPHCNYSIEVLAEPSSEWDNLKKSKGFIIGCVCTVITLFVMIIIIATNSGIGKIRITQLYNRILGSTLEIGMTMDEINAKYGEPTMNNGEYIYSDYGLTVAYRDGTAFVIFVDDTTDYWETAGGVAPGLALDEVASKIGNPQYVSEDGVIYWYYLSGDVTTVLDCSNQETVYSIMLYDENKMAEYVAE